VAPRASGLGRGLDALIPRAGIVPAPGDTLAQIPVDSIEPNPNQPRVHFDEESLADLSASIKELGVLQPILVRPSSGGKYQLVPGERRWRAVVALGLPLIPALVEELSDEQALEISVIENLQREDLSPLDEAAIFARMTTELGYSIRRLAERIGKDKGYVENRLRLIHAPADIRALVAERSDTISHAYELMKIHDAVRRSELAAQVLRGELSLARLKSVVREDRPELPLAREVVAPSIFPYVAPNDRPIVAAAAKQPAPSASTQGSSQTTAAASASDAALTNARDRLASSIDELATVLHEIDQPEVGAPLSETDRANMAKWLLIARNKLDNLAAILRQKSE